MSVADTIVFESGLVALVDGVEAYFQLRRVTAEVRLGWAERTRQDNQGAGDANRVVFVPGDDSGQCGQIVQARQPGERPIFDVDGTTIIAKVRALRAWQRLAMVSVWACDSSDTTNEKKQCRATDALLEQTIRGVHYACSVSNGQSVPVGLANVTWGKIKTTTAPVDRSFGREYLVELTYEHPIFDEIEEYAYPANFTFSRVLLPPNQDPSP
jgi:hypothetical protein